MPEILVAACHPVCVLVSAADNRNRHAISFAYRISPLHLCKGMNDGRATFFVETIKRWWRARGLWWRRWWQHDTKYIIIWSETTAKKKCSVLALQLRVSCYHFLIFHPILNANLLGFWCDFSLLLLTFIHSVDSSFECGDLSRTQHTLFLFTDSTETHVDCRSLWSVGPVIILIREMCSTVCARHPKPNEYIKYFYVCSNSVCVCFRNAQRHFDTLTIDIRVVTGSWEIYNIFFFILFYLRFFFREREKADMLTHKHTLSIACFVFSARQNIHPCQRMLCTVQCVFAICHFFAGSLIAFDFWQTR